MLPRDPSPIRLALSIPEAADALGIHRDTFDTRVLPHVKVAKIGRRTVVAVSELEKYLDRNAI